MASELKQKTISGMIWSFVQRFGTMGISFISNMVLARLLTPDDYGTIGMLLIFISISNTFIDGGFCSALIQKKEPTKGDYSTIFYWNIIISLIMTVVLYFSAPHIAQFYRMPILVEVLRVMSLVLIINALSVVQLNILRKSLFFKKLAIIHIVATTISSVVAIVCAFRGMGIWSLVVRNIVSQLAITVIAWISTSWHPSLCFSLHSFKSLGKFGSSIFLASLVETIYTEFQGLIIGKAFSAKDLGFYTQAKRLEEIPTLSISNAFNQVSFPVFASMQYRTKDIADLVRKNVKAVSLAIFPIYSLLIVIAKPLIVLLFTDKWAESIPLFQILCLVGMIYPLNAINTNVIKSLGKGKLYFIFQTSKRIIGILILLCCVKLGMNGLMWAMVAIAYMILIANAVITSRLIEYNFFTQIKDILSQLAISLSVLSVFLFIQVTDLPALLTITIQSLIYFVAYVSILYFIKRQTLMNIIQLIKRR